MKSKPNEDIILAHKHCANHKQELINDPICGCFYCMKIFNPKEIDFWLEDEETAICPYCGIDSIIGESSGFPVTIEFLTEMHKYWF
jgi:hypothetical protein